MENRPIRLINIRQVADKTGLAAPTLWKLVAAYEFPAGVKVTKRATRWYESEVDDWIAARPRARAAA